MSENTGDKQNFSLISIPADKIEVIGGEAGKALLEKISNGLGGVFAPMLAKKQVEAAKIKMQGMIDLHEMAERAGNRFVAQEMRRQINIEKIAFYAIERLKNENPDNVREISGDWIAYFFNYCDTVSNDGMQKIWGGMLAGEAKKSGSFSRRAIMLLSTMDNTDAKLFSYLGQFVCRYGDGETDIAPIIYDYENPVYNQPDFPPINDVINRLKITRLLVPDMDMPKGILLVGNDNYKEIKVGADFRIRYHNDFVCLKIPANKTGVRCFNIGEVKLTAEGKELFSVCNPRRNDGFLQYAIEKWKKEGLNPHRATK